ncbi:unnamed protein product [Paramecium octaurelia]|uniref:Mitochondrial import inner membrane translocase subunit TIM50 n=1 Tax=Paramecium octaurelia TaxID=43137 RepID=A0A8S1VZD8_PAROT|nr:unnamed protein product [Paramecium octaurelia]
MQKTNIKSVTARNEQAKAKLTKEQFLTLAKMCQSTSTQQLLNKKQPTQQKPVLASQLNITPRNNTPKSCRTAQEMKYFLYQKNLVKDSINKPQNHSQLLPKTKNSLHRNFSQLEKSSNSQQNNGQSTAPNTVKKKYNLLSTDSANKLDYRFSSVQFAQQIAQQLKKKFEPQQPQQKKENLHVSLDDFVTQINRPQSIISPFKQTKSLSPSTRVNIVPSKKSLYYVSSLVESFRHILPQNQEQQLFRDHAVQTFNCVSFCVKLQEATQSILEQKRMDIPMKSHYKFKKTVVFDLDETLIHCNENQNLKADVYLPITFPSGDTAQAGINIRPYAKWILQELSQLCEVIVFTASHQCYASQVIKYLDPNSTLLSGQLFRDRCVLSQDGVHIKDLRVLNRDPKDIVLVDNAAYSFGVHLENGIPIIPFYDNKDDKELKMLYDFLVDQVLPAPDCRIVLQSVFRLREYYNYGEPKQAIEKLY